MKGKMAIIAGLASAGMVLGASTAYADGNVVHTTDAAQSGKADWWEGGDRLQVCDHLPSDDWDVVGWIYRPNVGNPSTGPTEINLRHNNANGVCSSKSKFIPYTVNIHIKVCLIHGSTVWKCSYNRIPRP